MDVRDLSYEELEKIVGGFVIAGDVPSDAITERYVRTGNTTLRVRS
jgi:hypothetical protein